MKLENTEFNRQCRFHGYAPLVVNGFNSLLFTQGEHFCCYAAVAVMYFFKLFFYSSVKILNRHALHYWYFLDKYPKFY